MEKVGIAVIGCGEISSYHINALRLIPQADIRVYCDIVREKAEFRAEGFGDVCTDYKEAIHRDDINLVMILTPNYLHCPIAVEAAKAGKHIFVQKPFARTVQECEEMIAAAKANNVKLFVSFMHRYFEESVWAKNYIQSGGLGDIYLCYLRNSLPGSNYSTWQYNEELCGKGGAIIDVGVHGIDIIRYLLGDFAEVEHASKGRRIESRSIKGEIIEPNNEDWAIAEYILKNGARVSHHISWIQPWNCNRFVMEIHGSKGSLYLRTGYGALAVDGMGDKPADIVFPQLAQTQFGYRQHKEVIDAIIADTNPIATGEDGKYTLQIVEQILEKCEQGQLLEQ